MLESFLKIYFKNRPLFLGLIRAKELELFRRFLPPPAILSTLQILDFGSGDGFFTGTLLGGTRVPVTAADLDEEAALKAQRGGTYHRVTCSDGVRLPFKNSTFDLIISNSVLEHVEDLQHTVKELSRVLKSGGRLLSSVMTGRWEAYLLGRLFLGESYAAWLRQRQNHRHLLCCEEWRDQFARAGLETSEVIGYMDKRASRCFELLHYLSAPALISYRLLGSWVLFPRLFDALPLHHVFAPLVTRDIPAADAAALFFIVDKKT